MDKISEQDKVWKVFTAKKQATDKPIAPGFIEERKITPLYFRLEGPDLFVYKTEALSKIAFIIVLPVCDISI